MIELSTWPTANGHSVHIALEELGLPYEVKAINIGAGEQFKPDFLALTANQRIPVIVDREHPDGEALVVSEPGAILIYLAEKTGRLIPSTASARICCLQWLMFQNSHVGPTFSQFNHFANHAPEKLPYAVERYMNEVGRLHRVLERRLTDNPYLAGSEYSIADIATFPWVRNSHLRGIDLNQYPAVQRWHDDIAARPAVGRGLAILADRGQAVRAT